MKTRQRQVSFAPPSFNPEPCSRAKHTNKTQVAAIQATKCVVSSDSLEPDDQCCHQPPSQDNPRVPSEHDTAPTPSQTLHNDASTTPSTTRCRHALAGTTTSSAPHTVRHGKRPVASAFVAPDDVATLRQSQLSPTFRINNPTPPAQGGHLHSEKDKSSSLPRHGAGRSRRQVAVPTSTLPAGSIQETTSAVAPNQSTDVATSGTTAHICLELWKRILLLGRTVASTDGRSHLLGAARLTNPRRSKSPAKLCSFVRTTNHQGPV